MLRRAEVVLVMSPRYSNDVAMGVQAAGMVARVERRADEAIARCRNDLLRVAVIDARGAFDQGMALVRALGPVIERQSGGLLALLSRSNAVDADLARATGATSVLISPFNSDAFGNALRLTARNLDVSSATAEAAISTDATVQDPLTGLATGDQLQRWLNNQHLPGQGIATVTLGVGRIGAINAAYGRSIADEALRSVALRLTNIANEHLSASGRHWLLARLAAAEFAIGIAGDADDPAVAQLSQRLVAGFATPFLVGGREIHLTARAGIATALGDAGDSAEVLIRNSSAALAAARAGEPGSISSFDDDVEADALLRMADLVGDLHHAIGNEDINLLFQPVLDFASGRIAGVEALVRWDHRVFGLLDAETLLETAAGRRIGGAIGPAYPATGDARGHGLAAGTG